MGLERGQGTYLRYGTDLGEKFQHMSLHEELEQRSRLTEKLSINPYDSFLYLDRARCHEALGYPDLAAGDAYKAILLIDEAEDESGEYHEEALGAIVLRLSSGDEPTSSFDPEDTTSLTNELNRIASESYRILTSNLIECGCLKSAWDFCSRGLLSNPEDAILCGSKDRIIDKHLAIKQHEAAVRKFDPRTDLQDLGFVRRELYPWNHYEPDRFTEESISILNEEMAKVAPKCCVRAVELPLLKENGVALSHETMKQLGIFLLEDVAPGETILHETSMLTVNNRLHDSLCDACSSELPSNGAEDQRSYACSSCDDILFCSARCLDNAMSTYHPSICGKDVDAIGKESTLKEATNSLYLLLLGRTMALSATQEIHPLELKEVKYIWGDFLSADRVADDAPQTSTRQLPFSFHYNILEPLHILSNMDIDIFAELDKYDFWILNTLYAKFRGTASARFSKRDGRPEVCAVHPMWCLGNHSCSPNVRWEWAGDIKLWARGTDEIVRWGPEMDTKTWTGGIGTGAELLNHYCDVELDVEARREWALGALGGVCVCERCVWEASDHSPQVRG